MIVPRSTYERLLEERDYLRKEIEHAQAEVALMRGLYADQVARLHDLTDRIHQMVRDGYRVATPEASYTGPEPLPQPVLAAIGARAIDRETAQDMETWARSRLDAGEEPEAVVQRLWRGEEGL